MSKSQKYNMNNKTKILIYIFENDVIILKYYIN